jgi:hypothetical protein
MPTKHPISPRVAALENGVGTFWHEIEEEGVRVHARDLFSRSTLKKLAWAEEEVVIVEEHRFLP